MQRKVVLTTHAKLGLMRVPPQSLIFIDESPDLVPANHCDLLDLLRLFSPFTKRDPLLVENSWARDHPEAYQIITTLISEISDTTPLAPSLLGDLLKRTPRVHQSLIPLAERLKDHLELPLVQTRIEARIHLSKTAPDIVITPAHMKLMKTIVDAILGSAAVMVWSDAYGEADMRKSIAVYDVYPLHDDSKIIVADATLDSAPWRTLADANNRTCVSIRSQYIATPLRLTVYQSNAFTKRQTTRGGFTENVKLACNSLNRYLEGLGINDRKLGVICHYKLFHENLRALVEAVEKGGEEALSPLIYRLYGLGDEQLVWGYTGADGTGTNKFQDCDYLLLLGAPSVSINACVAQLMALTYIKQTPMLDDPRGVWEQAKKRPLAILTQVVGRLRHLRTPCRHIILVGYHMISPEAYAQHLHNVFGGDIVFDSYAPPQGSPRRDTDLKEHLFLRESMNYPIRPRDFSFDGKESAVRRYLKSHEHYSRADMESDLEDAGNPNVKQPTSPVFIRKLCERIAAA